MSCDDLGYRCASFLSDSYLACTEMEWTDPIPVTNLGDYGGCTTIASPNYPSLYNDNSDCFWSFQASDPSNVIQIQVIDWVVRKH